MNPSRFKKLFPLGSHLCREPMPPMSEMKRDMENLKRHGFNLIKLQEHWQIDEPEEGKYDFSRYEELIEHAARLDLGVYLGLTCEQAPAWLWHKYPDCRIVGRNGLSVAYQAQTTLPSDGKPGPCFDHPGAMKNMLRFTRKLVETLGRFENVVVWNTFQEIGWWDCYCPCTLNNFQQWLKEKHGDLDALNRAWNTRYADWAQILPERCQNKYPCAIEIEWIYFMYNVRMGIFLRAKSEVIRKTDPMHRPVFAHRAPTVIGSGQDWTYARCQDFLGLSSYPAWECSNSWDDGYKRPFKREYALRAEMWNKLALQFDHIRSANRPGRPVWAAEFQGGPVSTGFHKGRVPSTDDIRRWMLTALGSGVTALSFWVTRAEIAAAECNGFSLLDSAGDTTPRFEEAARIGQALNRHADIFSQPTTPQSAVAIFINERNYQHCATMAQGGEHLTYSVRGWYRLLWDAGIPVDFVEAMELDEPYLAKYKAIIMPFPLSLSEEVALKLTRYVESGGHLISEACPGRINEYAFCNRGELSPAMAKLFGVRQESFAMVREPDGGNRWSPPERTWGEYLDAAMLEGAGCLAGHQLRANVYIETFVCRDSEPCLMYGAQVAGVRRAVGKGMAVLLGTYIGHNGTAYNDTETRTAVATLLKSAGIVSAHAGQLLLRKRVIPGKEVWFFTNPTEQTVTEVVNVAGWRAVEDLLGDSLPRDGDSVALTVNSLDVCTLVLT